jgi:hypothetical protein
MNNNPFGERLLFEAADPEEDTATEEPVEDTGTEPTEETPVEDPGTEVPAETTEEPPVEDAGATPTEDTGTNEPVEEPVDDAAIKPGDAPDPALAEGLANDTSEIDSQVDKMQKELDELQKKFNLENEVKILKRRLDNITVTDDTNMNDSLNQSAHREIRYVKRAMRRLMSKYFKEGSLSSVQEDKIISELETNPQLSGQEIAAKLSSEIKAKEQDIFDFIRNTDFRFRHRHRRLRDVS